MVDVDEKDLRHYTVLLEGLGYAVLPFTNYAEAECCLEHERIDFIIASQGGPAFEGRQFVERTLACNRRMPVAVLTRCLDMGCYLEAMQLGAVDYLEKPLGPAEVERLVTTHALPRRYKLPTQPV